MDNCLYTLELSGNDLAENSSSIRSTFTVNNADTAPKVSITSPAKGSVVSGVMAYGAEVIDDQLGVKVTFYLDDKALAQLDQEPYQGTYATYRLANGTHRLHAVAEDRAGRTTLSETVTFTVDNSLSELSADPNPFTPNGDGWNDTTLISARLAMEALWGIRITDAEANLVREFSGRGNGISQEWDGRNTTGQIVADADYTVTVSLPDHSVAATLTVTAQNRLTPPEVDFRVTDNADRVSGRVNLHGYVRSSSLRRWWMECRPAGSTSGWIPVLEGTTPIENYLGVWDTTMLENGPYEVRLMAEDTLGQRNGVIDEFTVIGELKIGNYRLDLLDLEFVAGQLPARLIRSYDTLRKDSKGDFGYGWQSA
ncbi:MAG TPA: hypothetical protein DDZ65_08630, partial [Firmicutes bacterium]|nr:hypothetical protein [Bacillota bacterium]